MKFVIGIQVFKGNVIFKNLIFKGEFFLFYRCWRQYDRGGWVRKQYVYGLGVCRFAGFREAFRLVYIGCDQVS